MTATIMERPTLSEITTVDSYLMHYGTELAKGVLKNSKPMFNPATEKWDKKLSKLRRTPFQAQGHAVMGLVRCLKKHGSAFLIGECGVGKTLIGAATAYLLGENLRTLVLCPGHLTKKWVREIKQTVPRAKTTIIQSFADLIQFRENRENPARPEFFIISKDRAKLGYFWKPATVKKKNGLCCPSCFSLILDKDDVPVEEDYFKRKRKCASCNSTLWQADGKKCRRFSPAEFIGRFLRGYWDFLIADEVHELASSSSAQGNAFGKLASACKYSLSMTGTLSSGYAGDLFGLLFRTAPADLERENIRWKGGEQKFQADHGILEHITKRYPDSVDNACSKGKKVQKYMKRKPGVSPQVFSKFLMHRSVFLRLEEISEALPTFHEEVLQVEMDGDLEEAYHDLENRMTAELKRQLAMGSKRMLGAWLNTLLAYPDTPCSFWEPIRDPFKGNLIAIPKQLPEDQLYPKEEALMDLVREELEQGRRVFVLCVFTGIRDVCARLQDILEKENIKTAVMRVKVKPDKREAWVAEQVKDGVDVCIANPKLIMTGLDLLSFPTLIFFESGYSTFVLRQASRRSFRITQAKPCKVIYLSYRNTLQERALELMGKKLVASLALEGAYSSDGLASLTSSEDMVTALAKALVEKTDMDNVEGIWQGIQKSAPQQKQVPVKVLNEVSSGLLDDLFGEAIQGPEKPKVTPMVERLKSAESADPSSNPPKKNQLSELLMA